MQYLGALIANSIKYKGLIGVDFATAFVKALYGESIEFEDLEEVLDKTAYNNYKSMTNMTEEEIKGLDLRFNMKSDELIPGGSEKVVDKSNVNEYLSSIGSYYISKRNEDLMNAFKHGFEHVIPINLLKQYVNANEFRYLTAGLENITAENVLKVIRFQNANNQDISLFKQFLFEADQDTIRKFIRFTTGSSALPVDPTEITIVVEFKKRDINQLPIAHTCTFNVEIPEYKSYTQLKAKMNTALSYASEGFGIF